MRIAFLNPSGQLGGAERLLLDAIASLKEHLPESDLHLIAGEDGPLIEEAEKLQATTHLIRFPESIAVLGDAFSTSFLKLRLFSQLPAVQMYAKKLRTLQAELKPDIVHSNGLKMHALSAYAKMRPLVWHLHDYVGSRRLASQILKWYASRCDAVICNSNSVKDDFIRTVNTAARVVTIRNAIHLERFSPQGECLDLDSLSNLPAAEEGVIRIGLLSTYALWKGQDVFLKALSMVPRNLKVRAYIIGGEIYQTRSSQWSMRDLQKLAEKYQVSDRVGFTGFISRPEAAIRSLDIVVHASTRPEPFGLVIAEAMSCARAVIASNSGGVCEIIEPGVNAFTHTPGDSADLARQIIFLTQEAEIRKRFGINARAAAVQMFNRIRLAGELMDVYETALQKRKS